MLVSIPKRFWSVEVSASGGDFHRAALAPLKCDVAHHPQTYSSFLRRRPAEELLYLLAAATTAATMARNNVSYH